MFANLDPTTRLLAFLAIGGIAATTGFSLWQGNRLSALGETKALAADAEHVYLVTDASVFILDRNGALREEVPTAELQLGPLYADAAARNGELLLGDTRAEAVFSCDLGARRCTQAMQKNGEMARWFPWTLKMAVDHRNHLFVSDGARDTVEEYAPDGGHLRTYSPFRFPLGVTLDEQQNVVVADSNGHRLVALKTTDPDAGAVAWSFDTADAPVDRGRRRPVTATRAADGRWWVLMNNTNVDAGNLVVFDAVGRSPQRIPLRAGANPGALLSLGDQVLLADFSRFELLAFGTDGSRLGEFGDDAFRARLSRLNAQKKEWRNTRYVAWGALAGFIVMGFYAGLRDEQARKARGETAGYRVRPATRPGEDLFDLSGLVVPDENGIVWLDPDPAFLRMMKFLFAASVGLQALIAVVLWPIVPALRPLLLGFTALLLVILIHWLRRISRLRIGVAGSQIHLRGMNGRTTNAPATAVRYSNRRLRIGGIVVPIRPGVVSFFRQEQLDQHLFPLLLPRNRSPDWKLIPLGEWITMAVALIVAIGLWSARRYWLP